MIAVIKVLKSRNKIILNPAKNVKFQLMTQWSKKLYVLRFNKMFTSILALFFLLKDKEIISIYEVPSPDLSVAFYAARFQGNH